MPLKDGRTRNWRKYNEALVKRGSITFWISEDAIKNWHTKPEGKKGRPQEYSDTAIQCGLTLRAVYKMSFRAVKGFIQSLVGLLKLAIKVPDYTLLCKRQKTLAVTLPKRKYSHHEKIQILVDTTGIKVFGEGEWKVRQHGYVKHRLWRKLHIALNGKTQEIEGLELTDLGVQDCEGFGMLVEAMEKPIDIAIGDGAFDRFSCYELAEKHNFNLVAPPQCNAKTSRERRCQKAKASVGALKKRDAAIERVHEIGLKRWKEESGYHRRSLAETAMFRLKTLLGNRLKSRLFANQRTEIAIRCNALNKMAALGFGW